VLVATIEEFAAQVATSADLVLYDVERHGGTITVLLDRPGGIDVEALAGAFHPLQLQQHRPFLVELSMQRQNR
jgi:ribosome maturation factor RimP